MLSGLDKLIIGQILLLLDYSLRLAPSCPLANAINRGCRDFTGPMYLHHSD